MKNCETFFISDNIQCEKIKESGIHFIDTLKISRFSSIFVNIGSNSIPQRSPPIVVYGILNLENPDRNGSQKAINHSCRRGVINCERFAKLSFPFVHFHFVQTQSDEGTQRALFLQFSANDLNPSIFKLSRLIGAKKQEQISSDLIIIDHWISISFNFSSFSCFHIFHMILFFFMILYTFLLRPDFFFILHGCRRESRNIISHENYFDKHSVQCTNVKLNYKKIKCDLNLIDRGMTIQFDQLIIVDFLFSIIYVLYLQTFDDEMESD